MKWLSLYLVALLFAGCASTAPTAEEEDAVFPIQAICADGRLAALNMVVPIAGVLTIPIPPDVCKGAQTPTAPRPPPKPKPERKPDTREWLTI